MTAIVTDLYSDLDLADPPNYYGGFKKARVTQFGRAERRLSDMWSGDWQGSTMDVSIADVDRALRAQLVSPVDRYWTQPVTIRMTTRENRAALGRPKTVFVGAVINAQPTRPLGWTLTLADAIGQGLLSDEFQIPFRQVRDGFLLSLDEVNPSLNLDLAEPIIYGEHLRVPDVDPASPQGFVYTPTLLGKQMIAGFGYAHVWLVCGHAVADILDIYVEGSSVGVDEGTEWLVPHFPGWASIFLTPYVDFVSDTYGDALRYTLVYGKVGPAPDPDDPDDPPQSNANRCAAGEFTLTLALKGIEPNGDGSGEVITDRFQQYKHFAINYLANQGLWSYRSGPWLNSPTWALFDGPVAVVDTASFDAATAIGIARLPLVDPLVAPGYIGAAIIGANGERDTARRWLADWNRSCAARFGWTAEGQMRIVLLQPTAAIKAAAPLFTDGYEILDGSFETAVQWDAQANAIPGKCDFQYATGQWVTTFVAAQEASIVNYGRAIVAEAREYPFTPGITQGFHLANLESIIRQDPPRVLTLASNVDNDRLGGLELGDYIRVRHYAAVGTPSQIRLGQVQRVAIDVGARRVVVDVLDCEDLIDYAAPPPAIPRALRLPARKAAV